MSLLLVSIAGNTFHSLLVGVQTWLIWALAVVATLLVVISLYAHELAHAAVARSFGLPVRSISLFLLGGLAHIRRDSPSPRAELLIALAGPCLSLVIGVVAALASWACWHAAPPVAVLGLWLAALNLPLAIFNLVPAYPLDGGRVLRSVLWFAGQDVHWGSVMAARAGELLAAGLLLAGDLRAGHPARLGHWRALADAGRLVPLRRRRQRAPRGGVHRHAQSAFRGPCDAALATRLVDAGHDPVDVRRRISARTPPKPRPSYRAVRGEQVVGLIGYADVRRVVPTRWPSTLVADVMLPLGSTPAVAPDASASAALQLVVEEGIERVPVMIDGRLEGVVTSADLAARRGAGRTHATELSLLTGRASRPRSGSASTSC